MGCAGSAPGPHAAYDIISNAGVGGSVDINKLRAAVKQIPVKELDMTMLMMMIIMMMLMMMMMSMMMLMMMMMMMMMMTKTRSCCMRL